MKVYYKISLFVVLLLMLSATTVKASAKSSGLNTITQVQVICRRENRIVTRIYVQPHKIESVLNYLRLLQTGGAIGEDPELAAGDFFEITLYDATGQRSIYRQKANAYFSKNAHPWKRISLQQGSLLYPLIQSLTTDKKPRQN